MNITTTLNEPTLVEYSINFVGMFGLIALIGVIIVLVFKLEKIKELATEITRLQRSFDDVDGQAKLIVQTDLELHHAEEELSKKIDGLVVLEKLTRLISTTLDEEEIFKKIQDKHITELGFDRALIFTKDSRSENRIRIHIGYTQEEAQQIYDYLINHSAISKTIFEKKEIYSSVATNKKKENIAEFIQKLGLASFVCVPIVQKKGVIGVLLVGCESPYTRLTNSDEDLVFILAAQVGQALENAKLFEETWRSQQELENRIQQRTKELSVALEEIKIISKRKSDFISAVSHELRTPLTSIKGYAAILAAGKLGKLPDAAKERIEKINKHSDGLSNLINNLLDISRIESGRVELKMEQIDLRAMGIGIADMLAPTIKDKKLTLNMNIPEGSPSVKVDRSQIERIFINLIGNAIKFTPEGGSITVNAKEIASDMIQVSVTDTGLGISETDLKNIFEEFYRVDNDVNAQIKGTGLGLALVKYIVEAHSGRLTVTSTLKKGSTFSFTLPKA